MSKVWRSPDLLQKEEKQIQELLEKNEKMCDEVFNMQKYRVQLHQKIARVRAIQKWAPCKFQGLHRAQDEVISHITRRRRSSPSSALPSLFATSRLPSPIFQQWARTVGALSSQTRTPKDIEITSTFLTSGCSSMGPPSSFTPAPDVVAVARALEGTLPSPPPSPLTVSPDAVYGVVRKPVVLTSEEVAKVVNRLAVEDLAMRQQRQAELLTKVRGRPLEPLKLLPEQQEELCERLVEKPIHEERDDLPVPEKVIPHQLPHETVEAAVARLHYESVEKRMADQKKRDTEGWRVMRKRLPPEGLEETAVRLYKTKGRYPRAS